MEFNQVLRKRQMVRHFSVEPIDETSVDRILRAGLRAPSAGFSQGCSLVVLRAPADRERFWDMNQVPEGRSDGGRGWSDAVAAGVQRAPVLVAVLTSKEAYLDRYALPDKGLSERDEADWEVPYWWFDAGCVVMLMLLAAVDEGLSALFFGIRAGNMESLRSALSLPDWAQPVGFVAIGHAASGAKRRDLTAKRRPLSELVHSGRFGVPYFAEDGA